MPDLLAKAEAGQPIQIHSDSGRTFLLIVNPVLVASPPIPTFAGVPQLGSCKGLMQIHDNFDEPLEELREYWGMDLLA